MRVPVWLWSVLFLAVVLAVAGAADAAETHYFHQNMVPVGQADVVAVGLPYMDPSPPSGTLGAYPTAAAGVLGGNLVDAEFRSSASFDTDGASIEVHWYAVHPDPLAALFDEVWNVRVEVGDTEIASAQAAFLWEGAPVERVVTFENLPAASGPITLVFDPNYVDGDEGPTVLYDTDDYPSHMVFIPGNLPPTASLTADAPLGVAPHSVNFHLDVVDDGDYTYTFDADGDGVADSSGANLPPGGLDVPFTFSSGGTYDALLEVTDEGGLTASASLTIDVTQPFGVEAGGPFLVAPSEVVLLRPVATGGDGSEFTCSWTGDVGGLDDATSCTPTFSSSQERTHTLQLRAKQGTNNATDEVIIEVVDPNDPDVDDDNVLNTSDNCPNDANTDQADADDDGRGDVCDKDDDNDTIRDPVDNCPLTSNSDQADADHDGKGDACDDDDDNDTVADAGDNCPRYANTDQRDQDGDGVGDVCDADRDGDGTPDAFDAFPDDPNEWEDTDHDGTGNAGDGDDDGDGTSDADEAGAGLDGTDFNSQPQGQLPDEEGLELQEESPGFGLLGLLALVGVALLRRR